MVAKTIKYIRCVYSGVVSVIEGVAEQVSSHAHTHYSTTTNILDVLDAILLLKRVSIMVCLSLKLETEMRDRHLKGAASQRRSALKPPEDLLFSKNPVVSFSAPLQASSPPHGAASTHILAHIETPPPPHGCAP